MTTDELMAEIARLRDALKRIESLVWYEPDDEDDLVAAVRAMVRERDEARRDFVRVADALGLVSTDDTGRIGQVASVDEVVAAARRIESLRAEVEMLRGAGCREAKAGEPESGPCGVCLRCAEERGAEWAIRAKAQVVYTLVGDEAYQMLAREVCRNARKEGGR